MLRSATPDRLPMSMPTSIVVVQDSTSIAARLARPAPGSAEVDVLEEQLVLLGRGEHLVGLGGVELCGVLGRDDAHRRLRRAGQGAHRAGPVVALAGPEHRVGVRVEDPDRGAPAVDAPVGSREGPLGVPAPLAVSPLPPDLQRDLAREQPILAAPVSQKVPAGSAATLVELLFAAAAGQPLLDGLELAGVRLDSALDLSTTRRRSWTGTRCRAPGVDHCASHSRDQGELLLIGGGYPVDGRELGEQFGALWLPFPERGQPERGQAEYLSVSVA